MCHHLQPVKGEYIEVEKEEEVEKKEEKVKVEFYENGQEVALQQHTTCSVTWIKLLEHANPTLYILSICIVQRTLNVIVILPHFLCHSGNDGDTDVCEGYLRLPGWYGISLFLSCPTNVSTS